MNYKLKEAFKKSQWMTIIMIAIWIALTILFSMPLSAAIVETREQGNDFFENFFTDSADVGGNIGKAFSPKCFGQFLKVELYVTIAVIFMYFVGIVKQMPKNEFSGIESGSSDWAGSEKYSILHKREGIILAENHYLPVDKRGNVNVLVVGRFRFSENLHLTLFQMLFNF